MSHPVAEARSTPLHEIHRSLGASFTDFAGWEMPVRYTSERAEHFAVRNFAGLFDLSHMAEIRVTGSDASAFLDFALVGKLSATSVGQAKYSLMCAENGGIIDDLIVYRIDECEFLIVANAGNRFSVLLCLTERRSNFAVEITDLSDEVSLIAVQGPNASAIVDAFTELGWEAESATSVGYYRFSNALFREQNILVARTGYTGEDGFELYVPNDFAEAVWTELLSVGQSYGILPAGLACRDTLRLEAGMPLYGHELSRDILPVQAGLARVVALKTKGNFVGRRAIEDGPAPGAPVLVAVTLPGKRAARATYPIFEQGATPEQQRPIGHVTSGALSPTLEYPIAMAYVSPQFSTLGTTLTVDIRGTLCEATVVQLPFYVREKHTQ